MSETPEVLARVEGRVGRLTLNRPQALNALTPDMVAGIQEFLDEWAADPQIREADATRLAARESKPQAIATLLPQLSGSAGYDKNKFEGTSDQAQIVSDGPNAGEITIFGTSGTREPETKSWSLDLIAIRDAAYGVSGEQRTLLLTGTV